MIWLIGNKGMLGTELSLLLEKNGIPFVGTDREVDISDPDALRVFSEKQPVEWIVNCAAYTAVDKAEDDVENCRRLNTLGAKNIAVCAKNINARLIHISTDYVFNGKGERPYTEDDTADPIGIYGLTKYEGELAVQENNPSSYIIRTAWLYGKHGNNFVHTMLRLMNERKEVKVVDDQKGSPTWTFDLASVVLAVIKAVDGGKTIPYGTYHFTNEGNISWFDFTKEIYRQGREHGRVTNECNVMPCTSEDFPAKVKRPEFSVLDKTKIKAVMGLTLPSWDESLEEFFKHA